MVKLSQDRLEIYQELAAEIGNTPLVEYQGSLPNNNRILIKRECDNPFGSHYDRVYLSLFQEWEKRGMHPPKNVLESSSGSAGVSFSGIGKRLEYSCYVMIPEGEQLQKRREAILAESAQLILTPADEYINGFPKRIRYYRDQLDAVFLNHSMGIHGSNNETTLHALEDIATEVLSETDIDIFVAGLGNGSSLVGPGRIFKKFNPDLYVVGYKPLQSGRNDLPGLLNQDSLQPDMIIPFPHLKEAKKLMNKEMTVPDTLSKEVGHEDLGKTSRAGLLVALELAQDVRDKIFLVIGYDKVDRY